MGTDQRRFEGYGDSRAGFYNWKDRDYVSVTTALGIIDKPALKRWAAKMVAEKAVDMGADELQRLIAEHGKPATVEVLKSAPFTYTERRADIGSAVHKRVECLILGTPQPDPDPDTAPFLRMFDKFVADNNVEFEAAETTVYSDQFGYAGTLDIIAKIDGKRGLIDIKTGKNVYPEVAPQLAAYRYADFIGLDDGTEQPIPEIEFTAALHLRPRSYKLIDVRTDQQVFIAFRAALALWRYRRDLEQFVLRQRPSGALDSAAF